MSDGNYSLKNKIRLLKEIGYFPINNFCNLTGKNKDLKNLITEGLEVNENANYIFYKRNIKDFFRIGPYIEKYTISIFPIARYYLALQKEGKENEAYYSFVDYVRLNLKDTFEPYQKIIRDKEIEVEEFKYFNKIIKVKEEVWKTDYLNREINGNNRDKIITRIGELIKKYYPNFDTSLDNNGLEYIVESFLSDYNLIDCDLLKEDYDKIVTRDKEILEFISTEIDKIIDEYNIKEDFIEVEEEIEVAIPIYSDEEIINFIKSNKIWNKEFLMKFYNNLSEKDINNLLDYYNNKIWNNYKEDKENYNYYYYYFDKHLIRQWRK